MSGFLKALQLRKNKQDLLVVKQSYYKLTYDKVIDFFLQLKNTSKRQELLQH